MKRIALILAMCLPQTVSGGTAEDVLKESGVTGGLVVHLGCGDGQLTSALRKTDAFLVHGLDGDAAQVALARKRIVQQGLHGQVTVEHWTQAHLPFNDNLVNLIIVEKAANIPAAEIQRVLCPKGVAMTRDGGKWTRTVKPRPDDIDEWTHFLRDASNNAVAQDEKVGPPRHLQWKAGPTFTRDHDALASVSALTSSNGRIFYIIDEGPTSLIHRPAEWKLVARDAFNGKLLWKRELPTWITHLANFRAGPAQMTRRLVSVGDRVFVTLGLDAPVDMLDAATGRTLHTFAGTEKAEEILVHQGVLLVAVGDPNVLTEASRKVTGYYQLEARGVKPVSKRLIAYDVKTGRQLWRCEGEKAANYVQLSLAADGDRAYYLDSEQLRCLDLQSGKERWTAAFPLKGSFLLNYAPTVVVSKDVILCMTYKRLCAFANQDGRKLWEQKGAIGFASPADLFVIHDLVWTIPMTRELTKTMQASLSSNDFLGNRGKEFWGMDLHTGEVAKRVSRGILPGVHHHRCYRNKATENFLIYGQGGTEFLDLNGENHSGNLWTRGICQYGIMPANGYLYVPPHPCQCYSQDMLHGFHVLSASNSSKGLALEPKREKGPAFTESLPGTTRAKVPEKTARMIWQPPVRVGEGDEWPMFRSDVTRSGSSTGKVSGVLKQAWRVKLGRDLTAATVAGGRVYVCSKAEHILYCLDAASGKQLWQFATPGMVDSPPTLVNGLCLFGSADGSVYCLMADDGALRWRFVTSRIERRTVVDDHVESVWPIHGSVLVLNDTVYFAAGRSSHLDGGIRVFAVELASGELRKQVTLSSEAAGSKKALVNVDLLVADGKRINMGLAQFDLDLQAMPKAQLDTLISDTGFLGDSWFHRENWILGTVSGSVGVTGRTTMATQARTGKSTMGKLLVFDSASAYGVKNPYTWQKYATKVPTHDGHVHQKYSRYDSKWFPVGSRVFAFDNARTAPPAAPKPKTAKDKRRGKPVNNESKGGEKWGVDTAFQPRAIALADDTLFLAGWLDTMAIQPKTGLPLDPENPDPRNCVLRRISTQDGRVIREYKLAGEPAYDGMAIARGRLYLPLKDGTMLCFRGSD